MAAKENRKWKRPSSFSPDSQSKILNGGDDRIRTCGTLLEYNDLANRRFQPLSHVSEIAPRRLCRQRATTNSNRGANFVKAFASDCLSRGAVLRLDTIDFCPENTRVARFVSLLIVSLLS